MSSWCLTSSCSSTSWCPHGVARLCVSVSSCPSTPFARPRYVATFKGNEFFCYDLSHNPIQSSTDELTLAFRTLQRNGLLLHTGKSADYLNLSLKSGAVWLVINLGSGAFEALVEPVNGKFNDNDWHDIRVTRNLRQVGTGWGRGGREGGGGCQLGRVGSTGHTGQPNQGGRTLVIYPTGSTGQPN
uniref:Laminin G domain-containing protein n=1 Tax=Calidris pygmaea TaxID=425635 RepID=A0A8C3K4Y0_9CHAR